MLCESPIILTGMASGFYKFQTRAIDGAGEKTGIESMGGAKLSVCCCQVVQCFIPIYVDDDFCVHIVSAELSKE